MSPRREGRGTGLTVPRTAVVGIGVVVVLLVVVDVVLVTVALGRTAPGANGTAGPIPTFTSTPKAVKGEQSAAPSAASGSGDDDAADSTGRRIISAVDGSRAWRASSGTCTHAAAAVSSTAAPTLEHTTDAGATWRAVRLGDDVRAVAGLRATAERLAILAEVGDDCEQTVFTSADDGVTWTTGNDGAAGAGIVPDGIVLGASRVASPCPSPLDAFTGQRTTVVVCDGLLEWRTGTDAWVDVPLGGIRGVAVDGDEYTLARIGTASCEGVQIETMTAVGITPSTPTTPIGCNPVENTGSIAIDRAGTAVWMWTGGDVAVSTDGGATW